MGDVANEPLIATLRGARTAEALPQLDRFDHCLRTPALLVRHGRRRHDVGPRHFARRFATGTMPRLSPVFNAVSGPPVVTANPSCMAPAPDRARRLWPTCPVNRRHQASLR